MIGKSLSHFRILAKLGEGGMGIVYRAEDHRLRRQVALKVLPPELTGNEERRLRFLREARAAAAISHPNVGTVYDVGEVDGVVFIAMELVDGKTLRELMGGRPLPIKQALHIATEVAEGLAFAHQARVIHRDLKPDNIMVRSDQHVKILDFGLAKLMQEYAGEESSELSELPTITGELTRTGRVAGTIAYMSPEQARGQPLDARSDIFSYGSTLYEMVTGKQPFRGKSPADTLSAIMRDEPVDLTRHNPKVPPKLKEIVGKCLEKDPAERYQESRDLVVDLRKLKRAAELGVQAAWTPGEPVVAEHARLSIGARQWRRRAVAACIGAGLVAAAVAFYLRSTPSAPWLRRGDRVIVADFDNSTGRVEYDTAIRDAFEQMLSDSTFIEVVRGEELRNLVKAKTGVSSARSDAALAQLLCSDGPCAALFTGKTGLAGSALRINLTLLPVSGNTPAITRSVSITREPEILAALHDLVLGIRRNLGEAPGAISCASPPTTRSLAAYQAYALGESIKAGGMGIFYKADEALPLFKHAAELDNHFVDAYRELAWSYNHLGERRSAHKYAEKAYGLSAGLPDHARLLNEIQLLQISYDYDTAVERLKSYIRLCPFDSNAHEILSWIYFLPYENPAAAEKHSWASLELQPEKGDARGVCYALAAQGKATEIEKLIATYRSWKNYDATVAECSVWANLARDDIPRALESIDALDRLGSPLSELAGYRRVVALLRAGRLEEARKAVAVAMRQPAKIGWFFGRQWMAQDEVWLEMRRTGKAPSLPAWVTEYASSDLFRMRELARFSVEVGLAEPLSHVIEKHAEDQVGSKSRFVKEQIAFARGCLALVRGEPERARAILEPLARTTEVPGYHHVLARTYERLGMWRAAAAEYEDVLKTFYYYRMNAAIWALDQFRLARAYDRLGDAASARQWYRRFLEDWQNADPDVKEVAEARNRLAALAGKQAPVNESPTSSVSTRPVESSPK